MCYIWNEVKCTLEVELLFKEFFYLKIYQDNIFYILKFIYDISIPKQFKNIKKIIFFKFKFQMNNILKTIINTLNFQLHDWIW